MTEISRIPSGSLTFSCRVDFGHFLAWRAGTNSRYSTGASTPIKAGHQGIIPHLGTTCEIHHIYEDLNESSSARPGGSQQLEIPLRISSKQAACFFSSASFSTDAGFSLAVGISSDAEISTPTRILPSAYFSLSTRILGPALISTSAMILPSAMIFGSAAFSMAAIFSMCAVF